MNEKAEVLKRIAAELRELFPKCTSVTLEAKNYDVDKDCELVLHGEFDYAQATEQMRQLGIGVREKKVYDEDGAMPAYTSLRGENDGLTVRMFPTGLPPCCHREEFVEKIPKQQTVDTGEFVEVKRSRIVCGEPENTMESV